MVCKSQLGARPAGVKTSFNAKVTWSLPAQWGCRTPVADCNSLPPMNPFKRRKKTRCNRAMEGPPLEWVIEKQQFCGFRCAMRETFCRKNHKICVLEWMGCGGGGGTGSPPATADDKLYVSSSRLQSDRKRCDIITALPLPCLLLPVHRPCFYSSGQTSTTRQWHLRFVSITQTNSYSRSHGFQRTLLVGTSPIWSLFQLFSRCRKLINARCMCVVMATHVVR